MLKTHATSLNFVQPSQLHRLTFAPHLAQTPPLTTLFVHPSLLHRLIFAPCVMQTPPFWAWLVHPSLLHSFFFAPCLLHTWLVLCILDCCKVFALLHAYSTLLLSPQCSCILRFCILWSLLLPEANSTSLSLFCASFTGANRPLWYLSQQVSINKIQP